MFSTSLCLLEGRCTPKVLLVGPTLMDSLNARLDQGREWVRAAPECWDMKSRLTVVHVLYIRIGDTIMLSSFLLAFSYLTNQPRIDLCVLDCTVLYRMAPIEVTAVTLPATLPRISRVDQVRETHKQFATCMLKVASSRSFFWGVSCSLQNQVKRHNFGSGYASASATFSWINYRCHTLTVLAPCACLNYLHKIGGWINCPSKVCQYPH